MKTENIPHPIHIIGLLAVSVVLLATSGFADSYTVAIQAGYNLIANQLDHGSNTLNEIMPNVPNGCILYKYDNLNGAYQIASFFDVWTETSTRPIALNPGEGAWLQSPTNFILTFTGTPHVPVLPVTVPDGAYYLLSRQTNDLATPEDILGATLPNRSRVVQWNASSQTYLTYQKTMTGTCIPSVPTNAVGESAWIRTSTSGQWASLFFKADNTTPLNQSDSWWVIGDGTLPGAADIPVWDHTVSGPLTNDLGADMTLGGIEIFDPGGPVCLTGSNSLSLNSEGGIGIDMSAAAQNLTIACPLTVNSNQAWAIGSGRNVQMKDAVFIHAPLTILGPGSTHIKTMEGEGVYPVEFNGSSFTQIGPVGGDLSMQVDGSATLALTGSNSCTGPVMVNSGTLQLQSTDSNTVAGVCSVLGTGPVRLGDGATVQLLADSNTVFGAGTTVTASNATVTINADTLILGNSSPIISFASGGWNLGNVTVNVVNANAILNVGVVTMLDGPIAFTGPGTTHIHGINKDGVYPVDFNGSSYGTPSELEWSVEVNSKSDRCGPIAGSSELNKGGTNKTLVLWGTNSYAGPTFVSGGALVLAGDNSAVTNKTVVSGSATLALVANDNNTRGGVCVALGSTELDLTTGAALQLRSDTSANFAGGTLPVLAGDVTVNVGPLTAGGSHQTVSLGAAALICSGSNNIVNFVGNTNGYTLNVGKFYAHSGPAQINTLGVDVRVSGISSNGVYPVDFTGSSYGTPSQFDGWDQCGSIIGVESFTKADNKPLILTGMNNYSGLTTIRDGPLVLNGALLGGGAVNVTSGGTLCGRGTITGPVTVQAGAGLAPEVQNIGISMGDGVIVTVSNNLSLAGSAWMGINRTNNHNSDRVIGISTATYGGTLTVTNRGPALQAGDTFTLFGAAHYAGAFAAMNLPALNPGLAWDTSQLAVNGSISVVTTAPTTISFQTISGGGGFNLSWPANQGWILQQTTNLIGPWNDVVTTSNAYRAVPTGPGPVLPLETWPVAARASPPACIDATGSFGSRWGFLGSGSASTFSSAHGLLFRVTCQVPRVKFSRMPLITKFEDIQAWREARKLTQSIYQLVENSPLTRDFGLKDQNQRAAVSAMTNVAEGFDCESKVEFARFLGITRRSTVEVQSVLHVALDNGYISEQMFHVQYAQAAKTKALIGGFKRSLTRAIKAQT